MRAVKVPLLDLKPQYQALKPALDAALLRVAESQYFILGPEVKALEAATAAYSGCKFGIGISSGTDALRASCTLASRCANARVARGVRLQAAAKARLEACIGARRAMRRAR